MDGAFNGKGINKLKKEDESLYNAVLALDDAVWSDGVIDRRTKKLIAIAIVASNVNESGTEKQIRSGKKQFDFSKEEIIEVLKIVLLTSGMQAFNSALQAMYNVYE